MASLEVDESPALLLNLYQ